MLLQSQVFSFFPFQLYSIHRMGLKVSFNSSLKAVSWSEETHDGFLLPGRGTSKTKAIHLAACVTAVAPVFQVLVFDKEFNGTKYGSGLTVDQRCRL